MNLRAKFDKIRRRNGSAIVDTGLKVSYKLKMCKCIYPGVS